MIALHGTAHHVEMTVRCFRRAQQAEEISREARQQAAGKLTYFYDVDGSLIVRGSLPAEAGRLFMTAVDTAVGAVEMRERAKAKAASNAAGESAGNSVGKVSAETSDRGMDENPTPGEMPPSDV